MALNLTKVKYETLNARQQENYNYQKLSAVLADYGFVTMRLSDDWKGADLIAQHIDGETFLKVQLKGRLTLCKKYINKSLHIAFPYRDAWYLYPHDELLEIIQTNSKRTFPWSNKGEYSVRSPAKQLRQLLNPYLIEPARNRQLKLTLND
ncbi:MAG TPA: hypothetical protein VEY11_10800 [Pyrinomonadaceae bacterium]|nr:hypothetical protein [Pyrinomonadaceae bacterium]